jgi:hypothetical protein
LLHLHHVTVSQLRMLLNQLVMAGVGLGIGGCLGAEGEDDRAELLDRLGRAPRGGTVVCLTGGGERLEQVLLSGEDDLLLVTEVAEERGAADFGPLGDVANRDVVEAAREASQRNPKDTSGYDRLTAKPGAPRRARSPAASPRTG